MLQLSAVEAAFQLNPDLARQVVNGIGHQESVQDVVLRDNFGTILAESSTVRTASWPALLAGRLFDDITHFQRPLVYGQGGAAGNNVGQLEVTLATANLGDRFIRSLALTIGLGLAQALIVCALVVGLFNAMITKPLVAVARAIAQIDPARPMARPVAQPKGHDRDELGLLVATLNRLLDAFQHGLDERDQAEGELRELTRHLEQRVADRTRALEDSAHELSREKEEAERALAELDKAHTALNRANGLILESIRYASKIQDALLPDKKALGDGVRDIQVIWEPLHLVGGDYFWLERIGERSLIFIADCTGHGVPGAFMTMVAASALDRILHQDGRSRPSEILESLDQMVRARLRQDRPDASSDDGLDAAVCIYDPASASLTFAGANMPLFFRFGDGFAEIKGARRSLGYRLDRRHAPFTDHVIAVEPGAAFYLFTDGVPDHIGGDPKLLLGRRRLAQIITRHQHLPPAEQLAAVKQALEDYRGGQPRRDDMTLIRFVPA
jgi:serine phosphatase RsbU (regulator of sigma subunit)